MNNLFVLHTQYNLALAIGLANGRFKNDTNDVIVFVDFQMRDSIKKVIRDTFKNIVYFTGTYSIVNKSWKSKIQRYPKIIKEQNEFLNKTYDRVFLVCDEAIPEIHILKVAHKHNPKVECYWLEDGSYSYFCNIINATGLKKNRFTKLIRQLLVKNLFGMGKYSSFSGDFMGSSDWIYGYYVTFKDFLREEYKGKKSVEITSEEFLNGITCLYADNRFELDMNSFLLIMDKLDIYKNLELVSKVLQEIIEHCKNQGVKIYYKYHPREEESLKVLSDCTEINRGIGVECIYSCNGGRGIKIVGIKSTGLQTAKKCGYETISIANLVNESDENVDRFYKSIGINVLTEFSELDRL